MEYKKETLIEVTFDIRKLTEDHYEEVAMYKDKIALAPDFETYALLEREGKLAMFTARLGGDLCGYVCFTIGNHLHYRNTIMANNDLFYVSPSHRKHGVGRELLRFAEKSLKELGIDVVLMRTKTSNNFGKFLVEEDYDEAEITYMKYIGEG